MNWIPASAGMTGAASGQWAMTNPSRTSFVVTPAKAGVQKHSEAGDGPHALDSGFRRNDGGGIRSVGDDEPVAHAFHRHPGESRGPEAFRGARQWRNAESCSHPP